MKFFRIHFLFLVFLGLTVQGWCLEDQAIATFNKDEMDAAIKKAKSELGTFLDVLSRNAADSFAVKVPITEGKTTEHFWLINIQYKDGIFTGVIDNDPEFVKSVKIGQKLTVNKDAIVDWNYVIDGKIHGGYTIDPLLPSLSPDEAKDIRNRLVR